MHSRSKRWHMLDYLITWQCNVFKVHLTAVMTGTNCWSDHRLVYCSVVLNLCPPKRRHAPARPKKLNVDMLKHDDVKLQLQDKLDDILAHKVDQQDAILSVAEDWKHITDSTNNAAADVLGYQAKSLPKDITRTGSTKMIEARVLLDTMYALHLTWIKDKNSTVKKVACTTARQSAQVKLRSMKENWWMHTSQKLQDEADQYDMKRFYDGLKTAYGPQSSGSAPARSQDGSTYLSNRGEILKCWAEHSESILNQSAVFDDSVLDEIPQWNEVTYLDQPPTEDEVLCAIRIPSFGKSLRLDSIPPEICKEGGNQLVQRLSSSRSSSCSSRFGRLRPYLRISRTS